MAVRYNPKIITDGLVMALDAANTRSYPGSGSAWNDLSKVNWNGTLTNSGWSYSNDYITIPDNTSYVDFGTSSNLPTGDMSAFLWVYPLDFNSTWNILIRRWLGGTDDFHFSIKNNSGYHLNMYTTSNSDLDGNTVIALNNWYNLGFTLVNNGTLTFYVNGVADGSHSSVSRTANTAAVNMADDRSGYGQNGRYAIASIYDKALSASEVLQNYNAVKGRFGL